jgi:hypothetical protein
LTVKVHGGADHREMGERLGEVADLLNGWPDFLDATPA